MYHSSQIKIFSEDSSLLGCDAESLSEWFPIFNRPAMPSSSGSSSILLAEGAGLYKQNTVTINTLFNLAADKENNRNNTQTKTKHQGTE
jgi:hypothetical protein